MNYHILLLCLIPKCVEKKKAHSVDGPKSIRYTSTAAAAAAAAEVIPARSTPVL